MFKKLLWYCKNNPESNNFYFLEIILIVCFWIKMNCGLQVCILTTIEIIRLWYHQYFSYAVVQFNDEQIGKYMHWCIIYVVFLMELSLKKKMCNWKFLLPGKDIIRRPKSKIRNFIFSIFFIKFLKKKKNSREGNILNS